MAKSPKKNRKTVALLLMVIICIAALDILMIHMIPERENTEESAVQTPQPETESLPADAAAETMQTEASELILEGIEFPQILEDGKLTLLSMFQYSGQNPDCDDQDGSDIAGLMIENSSSLHLTQAKLELTADDGRVLHFFVSDIPAGRRALIFSRENAAIEVDTACVDIACEAEFEEAAVLMENQVAFKVDGTIVTVTNISAKDISNLTISCHSVLDSDYYGGLTYQYPVAELPAGESAEINALECIFGTTEVVRIETTAEVSEG